MEHLLAPAVNFLILVVFLAVKLRKPLSDFVHNRHLSVREELQRVQKLLHDARQKYAEYDGRLNSMENEIATLRQQAKEDARQMQQKLLQEAQRMSSTIVSDSRLAAGGLYGELKAQLYTELGARVLDRAEAVMRERLTGDDRARIRAEFSRQVETVQ